MVLCKFGNTLSVYVLSAYCSLIIDGVRQRLFSRKQKRNRKEESNTLNIQYQIIEF